MQMHPPCIHPLRVFPAFWRFGVLDLQFRCVPGKSPQANTLPNWWVLSDRGFTPWYDSLKELSLQKKQSKRFSGWWLNQPHLKNMSQYWIIYPNRGGNEKCLKPPPKEEVLVEF